jgi:hypothetical protein
MPSFNLKITQSYIATRAIIVSVEADDLTSAIEQQQTDEAPDFQHPGWLTGWELEHEDVRAAEPNELPAINRGLPDIGDLLSRCRTAISDGWDQDHEETIAVLDQIDDVLTAMDIEEEKRRT